MTLYATPLGRHGPLGITEGYRDENGNMHGTRWSYDQGCRCDQCRDAKAESRRRERARTRGAKPVNLDMGWADRAACHHHPDIDRSAWFPTGPNPTNPTLRATRVCLNDCPVRAQCEQYGRDHDEYGIWGGVRMYGPKGRRRR